MIIDSKVALIWIAAGVMGLFKLNRPITPAAIQMSATLLSMIIKYFSWKRKAP